MVWVFLLLVLSARAVTAQDPGGEEPHDHAEHDASGELSNREQRVLDSLNFDSLVARINPEDETISSTEVADLLHLVSEGIALEKPVEEALEGETSGFLLLTPELVLETYGEGDTLTERQLRQALPMILSCLTHENCALITDGEFIDHDDHDHEEHESEEHDEEHEENEEHDHGHEEEGHEGHGHEEEGHEGHGHEEEGHEGHGHEEEGHEGDEDDDDTTGLKMISLAVLFIEAVIGALLPLTLGNMKGLKEALSVLNCFAGGVLLSTGVIHLIPHVVEYEADVDNLGDYPLGMVVVVAGFALVFWIENVLFDVHPHHHDKHEENVELASKTTEKQHHEQAWFDSLLLLLAIGVHSVLEALVLGLEDDYYTVGILFASVAAHKGVTAMAISARFIKAGLEPKQVMFLLFLVAITAPIGIGIGTALSDIPALVNLILTGLSTGTFLYIGAYEVISEEFAGETGTPKAQGTDEKPRFSLRHIKFAAMVAGIVAIAAAGFVPHADHGDGHHH